MSVWRRHFGRHWLRCVYWFDDEKLAISFDIIKVRRKIRFPFKRCRFDFVSICIYSFLLLCFFLPLFVDAVVVDLIAANYFYIFFSSANLFFTTTNWNCMFCFRSFLIWFCFILFYFFSSIFAWLLNLNIRFVSRSQAYEKTYCDKDTNMGWWKSQ